MGRLWRRRRSRRNASPTAAWELRPSRNGIGAFDPADVRPVEGEYLAVRATPGGHLSHGLVVDASILARLLGIRLLKLDAHITFVPASFAIRSPGSSGGLLVPSGGLNDAVDLLANATQTLDQVNRDQELRS